MGMYIGFVPCIPRTRLIVQWLLVLNIEVALAVVLPLREPSAVRREGWILRPRLRDLPWITKIELHFENVAEAVGLCVFAIVDANLLALKLQITLARHSKTCSQKV